MREALQINLGKQMISGLVCLLLMFSNQDSLAQTWQWGKRGGSPNSVVSGIPNESVIDLATDNHGNVYFLAHAKSPSYSFENTSLTGYGQQDLILGSVNCSGNLRWIKVLGGTNNDISSGVFHALAVSPLGHVYVGGFMSNPPQFDVDTLHPNTSKRLFLVQYDTSGNFQWLRMPQPDTVSQAYTNRYRFMDMVADEFGNAHFYGIFNSGSLSGSNVVLPTLGPYVLKYNSQGSISDVIAIDMQIPVGTNVTSRMSREINTGTYYFAGQYSSGGFSINSQPVTSGAYLAAFNSMGQFLWKKVNASSINAGFTSRPELDNQGDLYIAGTSSNGDSFDGLSIVNTLGGGSTRLPFIVKVSSTGTTLWLKNGSVNAATYANSVAILNNEVLLTGSYGASLAWPNEDTLQHIPNQGYDVFIGRFDKQTGALVALDTLASPFGAHDHSGVVSVDQSGNVYIGGEFGGQLYVGPDTLLSVGGQSDFFIAKLGYPCGCVPPDADFSFTASSTSPQVNFLYTGSSNIDSLRWTFGDGNTSIASNPAHTYPGNGSYTACLEVYNACGVDSICQTVVVNCPAPVPAFSFFQNGFTVNLSYTGSAADSLHWDFGDGQGASGLNPVHTYSQNGSYTVCVTAFNSCGSEDTCETVTILSVGEPGGQSSFRVYPNPARERVIVEGLNDRTEYKIINAIGFKVQAGSVEKGRSEINVEKLPGGIYVLVLEGLRAVQIGINR